MRFIIILLTLFSPGMLIAQTVLTGKVMDSKSDLPLEGVTVYNKSKNIYRKAGNQGQYAIQVADKDIVIFSFTGYRSDTISIALDLIRDGLDIGLKALPAMLLDTVTVLSATYAQDSIARKEEYKQFYERPLPGITGRNTPASGFGISLSPISYFSREQKGKRRLKKRLEYNEQQAYINHYFSPSYVQRLTGLTGETLQKFMLKYRPRYQFVRASNNEDLVRYINDSLKDFKKTAAENKEKK